MYSINSRSIDQAFIDGMNLLKEEGHFEESRNGSVRVLAAPCLVEFNEPMIRVLLNPVRDANPFFHFMEGLWMLNGQRDVATVARYNSRIGQFSDDSKVFHGAYGHRWRYHFGMDQLLAIIQMLKTDPTTRRAVLQMWSAEDDLAGTGKDLPCNISIMFRVQASHLDMTVCNRSNDIIWGLFGANVVHMSMLHEVVASMAGLYLGNYIQFTNNFHAYTDVFDPMMEKLEFIPRHYPGIYPMVKDPRSWFDDLESFMRNRDQTSLYSNPFFMEVAQPIAAAWEFWKEKRHEHALVVLKDKCGAPDWQAACIEWIQRRIK